MLGMLGHGGGAAGSDELLERRHHREECQEPSDDPRYIGYTRLTGRGLPVILIMAILLELPRLIANVCGGPPIPAGSCERRLEALDQLGQRLRQRFFRYVLIEAVQDMPDPMQNCLGVSLLTVGQHVAALTFRPSP
jgi:hypothetical protein